MDDLDHSIHISEYDWSSFCEDSEECASLQPSLACPDDSGLSDSEDSGNFGLESGTGVQDAQQSPDVNSSRGDSNHSEKQESRAISAASSKQSGEADVKDEAELCLKVVHAMTEEEQNTDNAANTLQTVNFQSGGESQEVNKNRNVQTESDLEHTKEPDPLSNQTGLRVNELLAADRDVSEAGSNFPRSVEKERWFVTVNENPTRKRERAPSMKKKRRQKKPCDGSRARSPKQQKAFENEEEANEESEEEKNVQLMKDLAKTSEAHQSYQINSESIQAQVTSDPSQLVETCNEEENVSEKLLIIDPTKEYMLLSQTDGNDHESGSSVSTFRPPQLERWESDDLDDSAEFLSIHSYDSESYLSAAESVEEHQAPTERIQLLRSSSWPTSDSRQLFRVSEDADTPDPQMYSCVAETKPEGRERGGAESSLTFPSAGERAPKMSAENSTCSGITHNAALCMTPDTCAPQSHQKAPSEADFSYGDQLSSSPVPSLTVTPCSTADSPERYAQAAGHIRPVYAISAFWDEMEKLTINDILHLKMGRSTPTRESHQSASQQADASLRGPASPDEAAECSLSDSGLMDASDTADSDYFTQPDDSKPDRSSCEFSTSDFEEEYWQFLGASRNPSPDPCGKTQDADPSVLPHEDESAGSEGKQTPVPSEDSAGQWLHHQESHYLIEPAETRRIMKSKSMHNVHALNTDSLSRPSFGSNEESLFLSRRLSLDENVALNVSDSLQTLDSMSYFASTDLLDACYQISFPEVFEYFFKEDKASAASQCVKVYDPEEISVAPIFDSPLSTLCAETSSSSLEEKILIREEDPTGKELSEGGVEGLFSTLKQSDMCLVCIAFASWVLKSSDPEAADAWKAALLANVSALSAIQYLRQYVKKKTTNPLQDER
uniref:PGC-1 and ERR-induced regulator in muscle protein 1 n=1 Tax=Salarias fasciatus TaxID=181472 RepID=A0A672GP41_SALFA